MNDHDRPTAISIDQTGAPLAGKSSRNDSVHPSGPHLPVDRSRLAAVLPSDHSLVDRSREGDQQAAAELYSRYAKRLTAFVERQCSAMLARCAGVDDIVQSVFGSFFRRVGQNHYDIPDGAELWKLLLVIALNKIRSKATYYHAAKRDALRTVGGAEGQERIDGYSSGRGLTEEHIELVLAEILEQLPPECQIMAKLRLEGCEVAEVASRTGRSRRSVERILQETRAKLKGLLREDN